MVVKKNYRIKASSLLETIVAMVVMVLVFLFSMMIVNNVIQSASLGAKTKATLKMYELLAETKRTKKYLNESITYEHFMINKNITPKSGNNALWVVRISLENEKGDRITEIKEEVVAE